MSDLELGGTSHIHNHRWRRSLQCNLQLDRHDWHRAPTQDIGTLKSNQINGVLRTSILWGITQLGLLQIEDHGSHLNRHGRHINPLIAPPFTNGLGPEDSARGSLEDQFDRQPRCPKRLTISPMRGELMHVDFFRHSIKRDNLNLCRNVERQQFLEGLRAGYQRVIAIRDFAAQVLG